MENNKNIKVIARQIPPEYQESPFEYCDKSYYYGIIIRGNRDFVEFYGEETDDFVTVEETLEDGYACDFLISVENGDDEVTYKNAREVIEDYFPRKDEKPYNDSEIKTLSDAVLNFADTCTQDDEDEIIFEILRLWRGQEWEKRTICGSAQSEWNTIYYKKSEWSKESLERIEAEYFNTGDEWLVRFSDQEEDDCEYSQYTTAWNDDGIKKEIADDAGVLPEEVQLEKFSGWARSATYEIA